MRRYLLEFVVFICGAMVMVLELIGSRIMAPYVGTSLVVWTGLIGTVLGCLSLGYYLGGHLADKKPTLQQLGLIILGAALLIGSMVLYKEEFLSILARTFTDIRWQTLIGAIILFGAPSVLLGMVSPYAVRLKLQTLTSTGTTVGTLYALSTIGSIVGTFAAGFFLIMWLGSTNILLLISAILILTSLLLFWPGWKVLTALAAFLTTTVASNYHQATVLATAGYITTDTQYSKVLIYEHTQANKRIREMILDDSRNSAMYLENDELVYTYTKYYRLADHFVPTINRGLVIGGAGYSYPKDFLTHHPDTLLDVVEIDPTLTDLAKKYFRLPNDPRLTIFHEDGRTYLNRTTQKYDAIYGDAYHNSLTVPYQLTTKEALGRMYGALEDDGVLILNLISAFEGTGSSFLQAEYATAKSIFPHVYLFQIQDIAPTSLQNVILIAIKSDEEPLWESDNPELRDYLASRKEYSPAADTPILTDDYAPVDQYLLEALVR